MRQLIRFLRHPFLVRLFIAACTFAVIWLIAPKLSLEEHHRPLIAGLVAGGVFIVLMVTWLKAWLDERQLSLAIKGQARKDAGEAGPDSQQDLTLLEQDFTRACEELVRLRPGRGFFRRGGLYSLPWIVVIGPPAAGKTSALQLSGLRFTPLGKGVAGYGGTRNCTWWLSRDAIFLDTAGRYSVQEEDHHEWLGFLRLLRRHRPRRPIDAAIVQLSIDAVLSMEPAMLEETALNIQARLDELVQHLEVRFPVHMVFSKCDRLEGFSDYFDRLSAEERGRPWGFDLDVDALGEQSVGEAFVAAYRDLVSRLVVHITPRLETIASPEARETALVFPQEMAQREERLCHFVDAVFSGGAHGERPWLTSIFFTSATRDGTAFAGLRQALLQRMGLSTALARATAGQPASFFLPGMFSRIVERAHLPVRLSVRAQRVRWAQLAGALLVTSMLGFAGSCQFGVDYNAQRAWLDEVTKSTEWIKAAATSPMDTPQKVGATLDEQTHLMSLLQEEEAVDDIHAPAQEFLYASIDRFWQVPLRAELESRLERAAGFTPLHPDGERLFIEGFLTLEADHVLSGQKCAEIPPGDAAKFMGFYLSEVYAGDFEKGGHAKLDVDTLQALQDRIESFFVAQQPSQLRLNGRLRSPAEEALSSVSAPRAFVILLGYQSGLVDRRRYLDSELLTDPGIQKLYTPESCGQLRGAEDQVKRWLRCVLPKTPQQVDWESTYLTMYEDAWLDWLGEGIQSLRWSFLTPGDDTRSLEGAVTVLDRLVAGGRESAVHQLFRGMGGGTPCGVAEAEQEDSSLLDEVTKRARKRGVPQAVLPKKEAVGDRICLPARERFCGFDEALDAKSSGAVRGAYVAYLHEMGLLKAKLQEINGSSSREEKALDLVRETMNSAGPFYNAGIARAALFQALGEAEVWPKMTKEGRADLVAHLGALQGRIEGLERDIWSVVMRIAAEAIQQQWENVVVPKWRGVECRPGAVAVDICPPIVEFLEGPLEDFMGKTMDPFYRNKNQRGCELITFKGASPPLSRGACSELSRLRDLTLKCEKGGPPPAPMEVVGFNPDYFAGVRHVFLDTGAAIWHFDNIVGHARLISRPTSGVVTLTFQYAERGNLKEKIVPLAGSLEDLKEDFVKKRRRGSVSGKVMEIYLRNDEMPPGASGAHKVSLVFKAPVFAPGGGGGVATLDSLCRIRLPGRLIE